MIPRQRQRPARGRHNYRLHLLEARINRTPAGSKVRLERGRFVALNAQGKKILPMTMARRPSYKKRPSRRRRRILRRKRIATTQPNLIVRKLKAVYNGSLDAGAGTIVVDSVALNGAYDPALALGSIQPLGFDQYHALYRRNCVIGWKVRLEFCATDNTNPVVIGFCPKTDNTTLTEYPHYKECKGCKSTIVTPDIDKTSITVRGDVKKWMLRRGSNILDEANLSGNSGANPASILYGHIFAQSMDGAANPTSVRYVATLEQIIVFFEPIVPARS